MNLKSKINTLIFCVLTILLYAAVVGGVIILIAQNGIYPSGDAALGFLDKGNWLLQEFRNGNHYPIFDSRLYNGVETLRYGTPLPIYLMAGCIALAMENCFHGYLLYIGIVFFLSAVIWLHIGRCLKRAKMGSVMGLLYFFLPTNLILLFGEGNLAGSLCMVLLPWVYFETYKYLEEKKVKYLIRIMLLYFLITLSSLNYAVMILVATFVFVIINGFSTGIFRKGFHCGLSMLIGILLAGIWVFPAWKTDISAVSSRENLKRFFQPLYVSLNPLFRVEQRGACFYFGLAAFLIAVLGVIAANKKIKPFFFTAILIFALTSNIMFSLLQFVPGLQNMEMLSFLSILVCMIMAGLMFWERLRRSIAVLFIVLLCLDIIPSLPLIIGNQTGEEAQERIIAMQEETLIDIAQKITKQRIAVFDQGTLENKSTYLLSGFGDQVDTCLGSDWHKVNTSTNIVLLHEAFEERAYCYVFDRCLELGNDSILIEIESLKRKEEDIPSVSEAANRVGYELYASNEKYLLYHIETPAQFGLISEYQAIAIGKSASEACMRYPGMEQTVSTNLNSYSLKELCKYKMVYLDGFDYEDREEAEELIRKLSERGVRVVIVASGIPTDEHTGIQEFLGVNCQPISFRNGYPILETIDGQIDACFFPAGYTKWKSVYLEGLDEVWGYIEEMDKQLAFYGTVENDNIVVVGLGLYHFYGLTMDAQVGQLLSRAMKIDEECIPSRTIVPISVSQTGDQLSIYSPEDKVNTTLSYHTTFMSNQALTEKNNLLYVDHGDTSIVIGYPYFIEGGVMSLAALVIAMMMCGWVYSFWKRREINAVDIFGIERPIAESRPSFVVDIPDNAKYRVSSVQWFDETDTSLAPEDTFRLGKYRVYIVIHAAEEEIFASDPDITINGLQPDHFEIEERVRIRMSMEFNAPDIFRFLEQPQGGSCQIHNSLHVSWKVNQRASVGYLQVCEMGNWIIVDTVTSDGTDNLSYDITGEIVGESTYRIIYIMMNGTTAYSEEFVIHWYAEELG